MARLRIGHVDLDTSHPQNWIPIERELGHEVVGVYDGGGVWPQGYAREFADKLQVPRVFDSPEQMADEVDLAIVHTANWDLHVERARPFVEAGKGVLLDKPIVGNLKDIHVLRDWARQGARISGGSSLRFAYEAREYLARPVEERGEPQFAFVGCGVDEFNYGIHAYALLVALMGTKVESVKYLGAKGQRQIEVVWQDGRRGILTIGKPIGGRWLPFYATLVSDRGITQMIAESGRLYRALLEALLPYYAGEAEVPMGIEDLLVPELLALAARQSWLNDGARRYLSDLRLDDPGYDGAAFGAEYRLSRL
ncbi:MAG: Gfo/Idh/MocA family oxidoreductase [Anaerolineae bacterium]|nr:Gfo/Idh/MocA family oxidoreductase [Anaerolineae bacterium]